MDCGNSTALILLLARARPSGEFRLRAIEVVRKGIEWRRFVSTSLAHGVAPLIYRNINRVPGVPPDVIALFRRAYIAGLTDSTNASRELREIVEALRKNGIEPIVIKGVLNAEEVLGDAALYPSADIDILIRGNEAARLPDVMKLLGYLPEFEPETFLFEHYAEWSFFKEGRRAVDFHLGLGDRRYFHIPEEFWLADLRDRCHEGHWYKTLSPEKNLLFASIHLFEHGYAPLKFIVGIAEMFRTYENDIDWNMLVETARTFNIYKPLLLSLSLASALLDTPLHPAVSVRVKECSAVDRWIFRRVERLVFREVRLSAVMFLLTFMQYDAFEILTRMMKWMFPPLREIAYRYNLPPESNKVFFYYVLNPFFLILKKRRI